MVETRGSIPDQGTTGNSKDSGALSKMDIRFHSGHVAVSPEVSAKDLCPLGRKSLRRIYVPGLTRNINSSLYKFPWHGFLVTGWIRQDAQQVSIATLS